MAHRSKNKWIRKALATLGWQWNNEDHSCDTIKDIEAYISEMKMRLQENLDIIETAKENVEFVRENIQNAQQIIDQAEIEEFKAMNPKAKTVLKIR